MIYDSAGIGTVVLNEFLTKLTRVQRLLRCECAVDLLLLDIDDRNKALTEIQVKKTRLR